MKPGCDACVHQRLDPLNKVYSLRCASGSAAPMRTHTIAVVMILVPLGLFAGLGHASATHSAMTVSISPPTIEKGIWHNFSMTVHNDGANPVAIGQIEISFSWTTGGYFVTYLYGPPDFGQIVVDGAKIFNLGEYR